MTSEHIQRCFSNPPKDASRANIQNSIIFFSFIFCCSSHNQPKKTENESIDILPINRIFQRILISKKAIFQMLAPPPHLFEQITPNMLPLLQELERPKLRNIFSINKTEIQLTLTDNYIVLSDHLNFRAPTHFTQLVFELKFEVIYQPAQVQEQLGTPIAIKFERQGCQEQLTFAAGHAAIIELWAVELEKRINQRNFHKLFKAKKKIGKGAFATVYLAERLRDHKMVAVKAFSKQKQYAGDKGRQSLQNEIKLMRRLSHGNIMKLEGVYETDNSIYVILEYLEGMQLNQLLKSGKKLDVDQAKAIIQNILRGLSHLAKNRIIHRDLKPENIMFRKQNSWDLAICDFGLATYAQEEKYLFVRCGTPGFVAPEIINIRDMNTKSDPISDVFSAGIIFHHLLFGSSIFQGKKYNQILTQNRACDFNFGKEIYTKISPRVFDLLTKMLQKDPLKRITAEAALSHTCFLSQMDIEKDVKMAAFKELTNLNSPSYYLKAKDLEMTPSCMNQGKKEDKVQYFESVKRDAARQYLYS